MKRPLVFAAAGFVLGEAWLRAPVVLRVAVLLLTAAGLFAAPRDVRGKLVWRAAPFFLLAALGAGRLQWDRIESGRYERTAAEAEGTPLELTGRIGAIDPGKGESYRAVLRVKGARLRFGARQADYGDVLVYLKEAPDRARLRIGAEVSVRGSLERMGRATNPGQFDFGEYYHALGIEGRMFAEEARAAGGEPSPGRGGAAAVSGVSPYLDGILSVKEKSAEILDRICAPRDCGVFRAAVLGDRTALDEDVYAMYQRNGIAHLLAVSGLHISLIGMGFYRLLRKAGLGFGRSGAAAAAVTVSYGILTGASASVVRAVVMVCLHLLADWRGRTYDLLSAMAAAALLLLLGSPSLLFQAGFQLSFGAILAVGAVLPCLAKGPGGGGAAAAGLAIQIVTLPVVAYHFFQYPVWGFFLNLLVVPLMGYVLVSGLAGILLGAVWLPAGVFCVGTGHYILAFYERLCRLAESLPAAVWITGRPSPGRLVLYAVLWLAVLRFFAGDAAGRRWVRYGLAAAGLAAGLLILRPAPRPGLTAVFLDVGQGDGIFLETGGRTVLIDGGSSSNKELGEQVLEPFLKSRGIARVDYAVVSHGDWDHISGLRYLLEPGSGIEVGCLALPWLGRDHGACEELAELAGRAGTRVVWMKAGDRLETERLSLRCLYAGDERYRSEPNDHSLLLEAVYGEVRLLLTGDISADGERRWLEEVRKNGGGLSGPVQVLKTAHHGSDGSTCREFLAYADPAWAVISCGKDNRYGHPGGETMERLGERKIRCFLTMEEGAVIMRTDGNRLRAEPAAAGGRTMR